MRTFSYTPKYYKNTSLRNTSTQKQNQIYFVSLLQIPVIIQWFFFTFLYLFLVSSVWCLTPLRDSSIVAPGFGFEVFSSTYKPPTRILGLDLLTIIYRLKLHFKVPCKAEENLRGSSQKRSKLKYISKRTKLQARFPLD